MPSFSAARSDRSTIRLPLNGPRSFTRTMTDLPSSRRVTLTTLGMGRVRWAAVMAYMLKISPFAVRRPWNLRPYQDAVPVSACLSTASG